MDKSINRTAQPHQQLARRLSRRKFLGGIMAGTASASGVGPWIIPASALGRSGHVAPSNRITIGIIGMGRQAACFNLPFFLEAPDAQVVAICDVDRYRREITDDTKVVVNERPRPRTLGRMNDCSRHADFREVLDRQDVDAVMISTPDHWHVPIALRAVEAGKDICCEKPIGLCLAHGRVLADAVKKSNIVFRTDSEFRSNARYHRAATLVRNGRIGKLLKIRSAVPVYDNQRTPIPPVQPLPRDLDYAMWFGPAPEAPYCERRVHPSGTFDGRPGWFNVRDYCEGMLTNYGYHVHDIAQWANDSERSGPVEIEGHGEFLPANDLWNVCINFEIRYRYANGVEMHFKSSDLNDRPPAYVHFEGTEGTLRVSGGTLEAEPKSLLASEPFAEGCRVVQPARSNKQSKGILL